MTGAGLCASIDEKHQGPNFDYRHFGGSAGEPRQLLDIRQQQDDYRAAVGYARAPKATLNYAEAAPRGEIKRYSVGHFDIYVGEAWERAVADQAEFLSHCLAGDHASAGLGGAAARS